MKRAIIIIIVGLVIGALFFYLYLKKNPMEAFKLAIRKVIDKYGRDIAENVERIYRLETNHFKSGQFKGTFSPGMEKFASTYPYGWKSLHEIVWKNNILYRPIGYKGYTEGGTGKTKFFLQFPTLEGAVMTLAAFLHYHSNNAGRWYALDKNFQQQYNDKIVQIKPSIVNGIA